MSAARDNITRAVIGVIAQSGFEGLSVRAVAARAGVSSGAVQHHFETKAAMLHAAITAITSAATDRYTAMEEMEDPVERLRAIADALLPAEADDPVARVWLAFAARAAVDEDIRTEYVAVWGRVRSGLRLLLAAATARPETAGDDSVELLALLDGLALAVVAEHGGVKPATARRIAQRRITELVGG